MSHTSSGEKQNKTKKAKQIFLTLKSPFKNFGKKVNQTTKKKRILLNSGLDLYKLNK